MKLLILALIAISFCFQPSAWSTEIEKGQIINFKLVDNNVILVPVTLNDSVKSTFIFDTGGGINVLSHKLAKKLNFKASGSYSGKRMSGQKLCMSTGKINSLSFGSLRKKDVAVANWDLKSFLPDSPTYKNVEGVLSLTYFVDRPFTLDYKHKQIILESNDSLQDRLSNGKVSPIKVVTKKEIDTAIFLPVKVGRKNKAEVEVDTGSNHFILDTSYMEKLGINQNDKTLVVRIGHDQTNHKYKRFYKDLKQSISINSCPSVKQAGPKVMFQKIIYDGLIGKDFLKEYATTFDLKNSRMIFQ